MGKMKKQSIIARKASRRNINSEKEFVEVLKGRGFTADRTGKAKGMPDIVAWKNKKLEFYEIKPGDGTARNGALLKKTQKEWIKNYCFKTRVKVTLVYYKGSRPFKYYEVKLNKLNISKYTNSTKRDIFEETKKASYSCV